MTNTISVSSNDVNEMFFERGWTDGLPIIPPTPDRVDAMLDAGGVASDDVLGVVSGRGLVVTAGSVAVNSTMAGCAPEYFPVVLAAVDAVLDPLFNSNAVMTSTGGAAICIVVSGPIVEQLGINSGHNALGPGYRANATIGRALRLIAINVFDARPGGMDGSSLGNPGKYSLCFAESAWKAWPPHHVELGYEESDSVVTVMATEGPRQVANHLNGKGQGVLETVASAMRSLSTFTTGKGGQAIVVLGPEHALAVIEDGWTRRHIAEWLAENTRVTRDELAAAGIRFATDGAHRMEPGPDGKLPVIASADDVLVVTAGGAGAGWSAYLPQWASTLTSHFVARRVRPPTEALPDCGPDSCDVTIVPQEEVGVSNG